MELAITKVAPAGSCTSVARTCINMHPPARQHEVDMKQAEPADSYACSHSRPPPPFVHYPAKHVGSCALHTPSALHCAALLRSTDRPRRTGLNSTSIATPGMPITEVAWSMPPLFTPTWRSALHANSATTPLVRLPATPSTAATASEEAHTMAAELDRPLPAGRGDKTRRGSSRAGE
eukprot:GHRQ01012186.1.p1 GENE.GHRQ01012186.1~~GHRQ01012186.1.p1  ORF type:complete len:177 (+),score=44.28 GHRQ01012186.1:1312-1842(+)